MGFLEAAGIAQHNQTPSKGEVRLHGFDGEGVQGAGFDPAVSGFGADKKAFSFYDQNKKGWVAEKGGFKILAGGSSRDIALQADYRLAKTVFEKD